MQASCLIPAPVTTTTRLHVLSKPNSLSNELKSGSTPRGRPLSTAGSAGGGAGRWEHEISRSSCFRFGMACGAGPRCSRNTYAFRDVTYQSPKMWSLYETVAFVTWEWWGAPHIGYTTQYYNIYSRKPLAVTTKISRRIISAHALLAPSL